MSDGGVPRLVVAEDVVPMSPFALRVGGRLQVCELREAESTALRRLDSARGSGPSDWPPGWERLCEAGLVRLATVPAIPPGGGDVAGRVDAGVRAGLDHLLARQGRRGNFGRDRFQDNWETASAILALAGQPGAAVAEAAERGLDFLQRSQSRQGWFHWDTEGRHFCAETTAACGQAFARWGRTAEAAKVADFLNRHRVTAEAYARYGVVMRHAYPSVIGYLANFFGARGSLPEHVEAELDRVLRGPLPWRSHAFYFHTPLYYCKELIPLLLARGRRDTARSLLDRMHLGQNPDHGFGYCGSPGTSAGLPTAMAVRAALPAVESALDRDRVRAMVERLLALQQPDGSWAPGKGTMIAAQPDEFTVSVGGVPGLWPVLVLLAGRGLLPLPSSWLPVFGDGRFPRRLFFPCSVESYCTTVFPTAQAVLALTAWRAAAPSLETAGPAPDTVTGE